MRFLLFFAAVALAHLTLLQLPYFWDEGGYYVPAALDFYHEGTLIPQFTNAHPPLPNVVLGLLWHLLGYHILVTRLTACAFAAGALLAIFEMTRRLLDAGSAMAVTLLAALYPIWFAQSSLAHADIFAAAFTLAGLCLYLPAPEVTGGREAKSRGTSSRGTSSSTTSSRATSSSSTSSRGTLVRASGLFCLAVLAKETAVLWPVVLALLQVVAALRSTGARRTRHLRWAAALSLPVPLLALWFAYHRWKTGFIFGNPTFLRYNATANFTLAHLTQAFAYRAIHIFWQRDIWLPLVLALACFLLPRRRDQAATLAPAVVLTITLLILANWVAFSVLGGALLTRYLLPVYPLLLILCVCIWRTHVTHWPWLAVITAAAFFSALWLNPPTYFAPEDNLTYRDMIVVHQQAIAYLQQHDPDATVLTAWPAAAELNRPELGYTRHRFKVDTINDFSAPEIEKAEQHPGQFDTALVFTTHFVAPAFRSYLLTHPNSPRGREYAKHRDLFPGEIALMLGGRIVWQGDRGGEWAAVLRFDRRYDALSSEPASLFRASASASSGAVPGNQRASGLP